MNIILIGVLFAFLLHRESRARITIGLEKIANKTYYISYAEKLSWLNASTKCEKMDGKLADLQSIAELNAVSDRMFDTSYWLGINDLDQQDTYKVNGKQANFFHWHLGEPNNVNNGEHCVELLRIGSRTAMNDNCCDIKQNYICEIEFNG